MKVYVVEEFIKNSEKQEHGSRILEVFDSGSAAIKYAKSVVDGYFNRYGSKIEKELNGILKYYCCLDNNPEYDDMYADYLIITVSEHKLNKNNS